MATTEKKQPSTREGLVPIQVFVTPQIKADLKVISARSGGSIQDMVAAAIEKLVKDKSKLL